MLFYLFFPVVIGSIHWLIHNAKGELTERNKYRRMQAFGTILSIVLVISIFAVIGTAAALNDNSVGQMAGKRIVWIGITASVGWRWICTIWKPFDGNLVDQQSVDKSQGIMGLKFGDNAKSFNQTRITQETNSGNLRIKLGRSVQQVPYQGRSDQTPNPQWIDATKEKLPGKPVTPNSTGQKEQREFDFDKSSRMFIPKGGRSIESTKESAPRVEGSFPKESLQELKTAFDQGLIDADEYSVLKKQILDL